MREFTSQSENDATVTLAPVTFVLDGVKFEAQATVSVLDLGWLYQFEDIDANSVDGIKAVTQFLNLVLGPDVFLRLSNHIRRHRTDGDTLLAIVQHIVESITERPTEAPSTSERSTAQTAATSTEPSSTPATALPHRTISLATGSVSEAS
jgi:hypothetical protein